MSDTPRVDDFLLAENNSRDNPVAYDFAIGFARQLERELAAANLRFDEAQLRYCQTSIALTEAEAEKQQALAKCERMRKDVQRFAARVCKDC